MGDFSRWACGNKRCGFQHNYASRETCYKCGWNPGRLPGQARRQPAPRQRGQWAQGPPPPAAAVPSYSDEQVSVFARMPEEDFAAISSGLPAKVRTRVYTKRALDQGAPLPAARAARQDADLLQNQVAQAQSKLDKAKTQAAKAMQHVLDCKATLTDLTTQREAAAAKAAAAYSALAPQGGALPPVSALEACKQIEALVGAVQDATGQSDEAKHLTTLVKMLRQKIPVEPAPPQPPADPVAHARGGTDGDGTPDGAADVPMPSAPDWSYFTDSAEFFDSFVQVHGGDGADADDSEGAAATDKKISRELFDSLVKQMQEHHAKKARVTPSAAAGQRPL